MHKLIQKLGVLFVTMLFCTVVNAAKGDPKQLHFKSPEEAVNALVTSVKGNDNKQLILILGESAKPLLESGDSKEDKSNRENFLKAYSNGNKLEKKNESQFILTLGNDNWSFPIPLVKTTGNEWYFDTHAGKEEILNRRVGRNELLTVQALAKHTEIKAHGQAEPSFGYLYRKLGSDTLIAWPVTYGNSGIMTFMVTSDGKIYEKDLGEKTKALVHKIAPKPDNTWKAIEKPH